MAINNTRRAVFTSDHHSWLLGAFFYQWAKYDGRQIEAAGFTRPAEHLLGGHPFVSLGRFRDYPVNRWSDALIKYLERLEEDLVELWLEDYWLIRQSSLLMLAQIEGYMRQNPDVVRFDIGTDRMYAAGAQDVEAIGSTDLAIDIVEAKGAYSLSFQASLWRREGLLELLARGETPWQAELVGTERLNQSAWRVLGTRQAPVRYMIAVNKGKLDRSGSWMMPVRTLWGGDWSELDRNGLTIKPSP